MILPILSTSHYTHGTAILQTLQLLGLQAEQALQILVIWCAVRWQNKGVWSLRNVLLWGKYHLWWAVMLEIVHLSQQHLFYTNLVITEMCSKTNLSWSMWSARLGCGSWSKGHWGVCTWSKVRGLSKQSSGTTHLFSFTALCVNSCKVALLWNYFVIQYKEICEEQT